MRVALFAADTSDVGSLAALAEDIEVDRHASPASPGPAAVSALVASFRAAEEALAEDPPDAAIVAGEDDAALAAALTAAKLDVPTAWLRPPGTKGQPLVERVAGAAIDAEGDASALASAVRSLAAPTITAP